jgi:hypothetical protein
VGNFSPVVVSNCSTNKWQILNFSSNTKEGSNFMKKTGNDVIDLYFDEAYVIIKDMIYFAKKQYDKLSVPEKEYCIQDNKLLREKIVDPIEKLLPSIQQTRKIKAETHKDLIKQLGEGKITPQEARMLSPVIEKKLNEEEEW